MHYTVDSNETRKSFERVRDIFIQRWGEMGDCWGINRTMAEIHALLYLSPEPLCTDDIMERLQISRGNASMNLRGLADWGLISRTHKRGDRKEYFTSETDVWSMFETITRQRKKREIEPVIETIQQCMQKLQDGLPGGNGAAARPARRINPDSDEQLSTHEQFDYCRERLENMLEFLAAMNKLFDMFLQGGRGGMKEVLTALVKPPVNGRS